MRVTNARRSAKVVGTLPVKRIAQDYLVELGALIERIDLDALERVVQRLRDARDTGAMIYLAGNGGSAATAAHWANDLGKATKRSGRPPLRVMCLTSATPWITALANDEGYDRVFAGQLENFARPGDVLVVISASGNSENLVKAVQLARERSLMTVGLLGFDGGVLKNMVTDPLWLKTEIGQYGLVETMHSVLADIITTCLIGDGDDASTRE